VLAKNVFPSKELKEHKAKTKTLIFLVSIFSNYFFLDFLVFYVLYVLYVKQTALLQTTFSHFNESSKNNKQLRNAELQLVFTVASNLKKS